MTRFLAAWLVAGLVVGATALTGIDKVARLATVIAPDTSPAWPWVRALIAIALVAAAIGVALTQHRDRRNADR